MKHLIIVGLYIALSIIILIIGGYLAVTFPKSATIIAWILRGFVVLAIALIIVFGIYFIFQDLWYWIIKKT